MKSRLLGISLLVFSLSLSLAIGRSAAAMPVDAVPNPQVAAGSFVADAAGVVGPEWSRLIDGVSRELKSAIGAELAVVTVDSLDGTTVEDYAARLFKRFGIGAKGKDDGLLLLFALSDRKVRIEVGYGLEGTINDAKAGRLLDEFAVPRFREGQYARGLYDAAFALAKAAAGAEGAAFDVATPAELPAQPASPEAAPAAEAGTAAHVLSAPFDVQLGMLAGAMGGTALLGFLLLMLRVGFRKARAAKTKAMGLGAFLPAVVWGGGGIAALIVGAENERFLAPFLVFAPVAVLVTFLHIRFRGLLRRRIAAYALACPKCGKPMRILSEKDDDAKLSQAEIAEEKAGGMDYEFWECASCGASERLEVKLGKASACPKCRRRTLVTTMTTLVAATTSHGGKEKTARDCRNPGCGFHDEKTRSTASLSSGGSSSGGGSSGGGSSFGGGSSGGGGASRGW